MKNIHIIATEKPSRLHLAYDKDYYLSVEHFIQSDTKNYKSFNIYITSDEEIKEGELKKGDWYYSPIHNKVFQCIHNNQGFELERKIILTTDQDLIKDSVQAINDEFLEWFVKNPSCEEVEVEIETTSIQLPQQQLSENSYDLAFRWINKKVYKIIIPKEEPKKIYYNTVGRENGVNVVKGQFNTQKEALDLANELNRKFPDLYYDWRETLIKEEPKQFVECKCTNSLQAENCIRNCGHGEEPKQETLEEAAERLYPTTIDSFTDGGFDLSERERLIFINGAEWQQERMYSEEEVFELLLKSKIETSNLYYEDMKEWFEQFKKN